MKQHTSIVKRVLEDKGLQAVSHGIIDEQNISILLKKMENEIRQLK